mgnify:CR=1 FL=1
MRKIRKLVMDKKGMSYPLTVALVLALLIALCVLAEFFRLSIIAYGVRNALQESVISVATTNYNEVYDGLREGYSGGYFMTGDCWEETLDYGNASQNFEADVSVQLEIPLSFGWEALPPVRMTIRAKAAYMPKF